MDEAHPLICRLRHARGAARLSPGAQFHTLERGGLHRAERARVLAGLRGISSAFCLGGTLTEQLAEHLFYTLEIEGLAQKDRIFETRGGARLAATGGEGKRHPSLLKPIGHHVAVLTAEIDIDDRRV